jgi:hypothetical protein
VCPYYLDGDLGRTPESVRPVITRVIGYCAVFKVRGGVGCCRRGTGTEVLEPPTACRSLKTQQHASRTTWDSRAFGGRLVEVRSTCLETARAREQPAELESSVRLPRYESVPSQGGLPRKEVIQPQLPLRLPCYDFTPVTSPTFDGSLPKGLGHRLRVLLTPVV